MRFKSLSLIKQLSIYVALAKRGYTANAIKDLTLNCTYSECKLGHASIESKGSFFMSFSKQELSN